MPTKMVVLKKVDKVIRKRKTPSQWSNLPIELLLKIMDGFNLADQIRFRCVCKNWLSLPLLDNRAIFSLLPWLVTGGDHLRELNRQIIYCRLFDFVRENPLQYFETYTDAATSKHGWVISTKDVWDKSETSFIYSCPFSKETVTLPEFYHGYRIRKLTISSYPTSKECVFCIVYNDGDSKIKVATYKHGYENWIVSESYPWISCLSEMRMLFFQGDLYCFDRNQKRLFVYNVAQQFWNNSFHTLKTHYYCDCYFLIESAGELLLVCANLCIHWWVIYTFDAKSLTGWVVKTSLSERALFIGHKKISVPASGDFKHMENKIFFRDPYKKKIKFYDLIDGESYDCEGSEYQMLARNYGSDIKCIRVESKAKDAASLIAEKECWNLAWKFSLNASSSYFGELFR